MNMTRAAAELGITQSAVSRQVRHLEARLGLRLFDRSKREIALTGDGEELFGMARQAFDLIETTAEKVTARSRPVLRLRAYIAFSMRWLIPRLPAFTEIHPEFEVRLTTSMVPVNFDRDDVDLAIQWGAGDWPNATTQRLMRNVVTPVCSPRLIAGKDGLRRPADLARHTLLHSMPRPDDWNGWLDRAGIAGLDVGRGLSFENSALAYQAALEGLGVAIGQLCMVGEDLAAGRLVQPFPLAVELPQSYYLVRPRGPREPAHLKAFRAWIVEEARKSEEAVGDRVTG
jgi:LysR family glycine cleavage system transcriptional activator